ncbi:MAG: YqiJ family protein [Leptolyngbya sp. RL_3_1]|nr:YqiJ family protein [Leptolyngbya sp. RL_3_1]
MLFSLANLPYWIFLVAGVLLFLFVILSGGGDDDMDVDGDLDVDADVDVDVDVDLDVDADADVEPPLGIDGDGDGFSPMEVLAWFGVGRTPLLLLLAIDLTLWGFGGWLLNVAIGEALESTPAGLIAVGIFIGSFTFSVVIGSLLSHPIGRIFAAFGEDASGDRLVGCLGTVTSAFVPLEDSGKIGQADVKDAAHNLVTISVKLPTWATISLRHGAPILVIDHQRNYYLVIARNSPDQDRWMSDSTPAQSSTG